MKVDLWSHKDPLLQPMQKVRDQQERERSYRAVFHLADKHFVQLATPDLPNVNAGRRSGAGDRHLGRPLPEGDVLGPDLQRRLSARPEDRQAEEGARALGSNAATMSPGGKYVLHFDESTGHWFTYRVADGARVNLTEKLPSGSSRRTTRPTCPARTAPPAGPPTTGRCCSTTSSTSGK